MTELQDKHEVQNAVVSASGSKKVFYIFFILLILITITCVALSAATLSIVRRDSNSNSNLNSSSKSGSLSLADQITVEDLLKHLEQLQVIADQSGGTRAITTRGFNGTLDYITRQLEQNTKFILHHQYFTVPNYVVRGTPQLQSQVNGAVNSHVYLTDFAYMVFSARANFTSFVRLVVIPNLGCQDADWSSVSAADAVVLVKRGDCTYVEKVTFAENYRVRGLLVYNDGTAADRFQALQGVRAKMNSSVPAFFLSYSMGMQLVNAANDAGENAGIMMNADVSDAEGIGNICADTPSGDITKTIVVGAHSDGVPAGSGINDNGSGTIGLLVLALNLARLFQTSSNNYPTYPYRVRFCWWGAEEIGLLGSIYHVEQAILNSDKEGERFQDYLLNLNYDMLAGPNYRFGIHDSEMAPTSTPLVALNGTSRITALFRQWFTEQKLPWSNSSLGGGSDYVPFLANGLAVGGVNTGAGGIKTAAERDQYAAILGTGNGGIANAAFDTCYHQQCDRITNINPFAYEKVVKAAAYAIEYMGRLNDLEKWLYPQGRPKRLERISRSQLYNIQNDPELY
ncbi:unnamed protein product [Rotaria socialis]|uniref:Peptide hydrolase n=1 Tax=Rotaria socialis TaxID=392032 RepID=A0A817T9E4_9BILA|nr:unnamed protein product [Rotaria socialis]CAF4257529.1 unnamed protein product [Rotaria socialis]